jgi:hypothetical protein
MFLCNNDINTPLYTKGQIIDSYYNKGHNYKFQYTVANKKHFLTKRAYISNLKEGEYYMIEYDSLNPKNAKVNLNKPFIEDSTSYEGNFARVIKIEDKQSNRILFKYTYGNKEYQRVQYYNGKINIGDELNILVKFNNPNISYIK